MATKITIKDQIFHSTPGATTSLFFITGNPGLVSYYTSFLGTLHQRLNDHETRKVNVFGRSMAGFEVANAARNDHSPSGFFGLQDQITFTEQTLRLYAQQQHEATKQRPRIVLIGHSVGSYILLEVLKRHQQARDAPDAQFDIISGICLFPTVVDIVKSPTGQRAGWILQQSWTPSLLSSAARGLAVLPTAAFDGLVKTVTGMPEEGATVTAAFLKSERGVQQALHMARDEMVEITADQWDQEIWGSSNEGQQVSLFFYFGKDDHWVAERTKQDLIATRGRTDKERWKPLMEVDELSIPHAFCMRHSVEVADRVVRFVQELPNL